MGTKCGDFTALPGKRMVGDGGEPVLLEVSPSSITSSFPSRSDVKRLMALKFSFIIEISRAESLR